MFFLFLATRRDTQKLLIERYSQCKVRIDRNTGLDKLLITRRSAKITARRRTIVFDGFVAPPVANRSTMLFKKISDKPFATRRRSMCAKVSLDKSDDQNVAHQHVQSNEANEDIAVPGPSGLQDSVISTKKIDEAIWNSDVGNDEVLHSNNENNCDEVIEATTTIASSVNESTFSDADKENVLSSEEVLFPFLPSVIVQKEFANANKVSTILDSAVPNFNDLPIPIVPLSTQVLNAEGDLILMDLEVSSQILDASVPELIDLPAPIAPLRENGETKRLVPSLIPICDMNVKTYGPAKKASKTSQMILGVLDKFEEQQKEQSVSSKEINIAVDIESDESMDQNEHSVSAEEINIAMDFESLIYNSDSE